MTSRFLTSRWAMLLILFFYSIALWRLSIPLTGDQKVYLSIALEMKERGSLLIPFLSGSANFLKPPFQYWMTLIGWKAFGLSLFGCLFPSVLALLGSAFLIRKIGKTKSYLPALFFAGTLGTLTYGTTAQMEIWIVLFYLSAWALWLEERIFSAFLVVGLMSLVKGPLYSVLWVLSVVLYQFLTGNLKRLVKPRFFVSLTFGILVGLTWYILVYQQYPQEIVDVFFKRENLGKMQTSQGSIFGLWSEFLFSLFPILIWLCLSLSAEKIKEQWKQNKYFWISYALIPALFFTFFPYRVNTYLYLLTPLGIWCLSLDTPKISNSLRLSFSLVTILIALILGFLSYRLWMGAWIGFEIALPLMLSLLIWSYGHWSLNAKWVALSSLLIVSLIRLGAIEIGEWDLQGLREAQEADPKPISYFMDGDDIWHEYGLLSAAVQEDIGRIHQEEKLQEFLKTGGRVIFSDEALSHTSDLKCVDWTRIKRRIKFPIFELLSHGLSIDDPSLHRTFRVCQQKS